MKRIAAPVDVDLEITEITNRVSKAGGPALYFEKPRSARDEQSGAAVQQHNIPQRSAGAGEQIPHQFGIVLRLAATNIFEPRSRQPEILRNDLERLDLAPLERRDRRRARGGQLVETVAVHDPGVFRAEPPEHLGHRAHPLGREPASPQLMHHQFGVRGAVLEDQEMEGSLFQHCFIMAGRG